MPTACTTGASWPTGPRSTPTAIPAKVIAAWSGKRIHQSESITVHSFEPGFIDAAVAALERRNTLTLSITERRIYLELNGTTLTSAINDHLLDGTAA